MPDITRGVRAFTIGTAISRVFGLIRESVFAYLFGAGMNTDAFNAAFRIPNLFRDLFAETSLSAAFIPILSAEKLKGKRQQNLLASNMFNILFITVGAVVVIGMVCAPYIVKIITYGFGSIPNKLSLTASLTTLMFPFLLFIAFAAWAMGYLNTEREFFVPSLAPAFFNVFSIAVPVILFMYLVNRDIDPIFGMAIGAVLGGIIQFAIQLPILYKKGFRYHFYLNFKDPNFKKIFTLFIPVALGLAASRINVTVDLVLISFLQERSMTWLNYAFRIMHLPLGLFGIAVGTVTLPTFSKYVADHDHDAVRATFFDSLKLVFFLTVSSAIIIAFLAFPITRIIYERGKFTAFDTWATTRALILYVIGIPFMAGIRNTAAVFYAYKDSKTPMYASLAAVIVHIVISLVLMRIIGYLAFPVATTIAAFINITILIFHLPKKIGDFRFAPMIKYFILITLAAVAGGVIAHFVYLFLYQKLGISFFYQITTLLLSGTVAGIIFYLSCRLLSIREARDYLKRLITR